MFLYYIQFPGIVVLPRRAARRINILSPSEVLEQCCSSSARETHIILFGTDGGFTLGQGTSGPTYGAVHR